MWDFTPAQLALIETSDSTYFEACPGAGKTQAIVERFARRTSDEPRRGIALLSFTNAVVDEASKRSSADPTLRMVPNFIGTIDGFINRFIVAPLFVGETGIAPTFHTHWGQLPGSEVTVGGVAGKLGLDWFEFHGDGTATLKLAKVPADRRYFVQSLKAPIVSRLQDEASRRWIMYTRKGILDASAARFFMSRYLRDVQTRSSLVQLMSSRFFEVIVDEIQDCCDEDVILLELLHEAGVRLVVVGDPQQAIFGFRGASSGELGGLLRRLETGNRLNDNFRSSPNICGVVTSLRCQSFSDNAVGRFAASTYPIKVLAYGREADVRSKVSDLAIDLGFQLDDIVVLAHSTAKARQAAGWSNSSGSGGGTITQLARLIAVIQDEANPQRLKAESLGHIERLFRHLAAPAIAVLEDDAFYQTIGMSSRQYREACLRLAATIDDPFCVAPSVFRISVLNRALSGTLAIAPAKLRAPNGDRWPSRPVARAGSLRYSTIHSFKGLQAPMVALVLPDPNEGIAAWTSGADLEERNVIYVGASRAEQLLVLAVDRALVSQVTTNLSRDNVAFELVN